MQHPLVSVILPFYNAKHTLTRAIESIIAQTFSDWELLLINNNSDRESVLIAEKFASEDVKIQLYNEPNQGIAFAINTGLRNAKGRLISRMDADDISYKSRLQKQAKFLQEHHRIDVVSCQADFHSDCNKSTGFELFVQWQNQILTPEDHFLNRFIESPLAHPTIMFRKRLIEQYGYYLTDSVPEDYELWLRWMSHGVHFQKIAEPLLLWNDHSHRLSRTHNNYSEEAFHHIRGLYLSQWIMENVDNSRKIVICGSSINIRRKSALLEKYGVSPFGFTDVKEPGAGSLNFIPLSQINKPENWFLVSFISKRGVGRSIRKYFSKLGFQEGRDFILAG